MSSPGEGPSEGESVREESATSVKSVIPVDPWTLEVSLTEDVDKDWVVPKVLDMALLDVEPKADLGALPPPLDVAEMGVLVAEEVREVFSATDLWLLLTPRIQ